MLLVGMFRDNFIQHYKQNQISVIIHLTGTDENKTSNVEIKVNTIKIANAQYAYTLIYFVSTQTNIENSK